jgi:hypothetical protein
MASIHPTQLPNERARDDDRGKSFAVDQTVVAYFTNVHSLCPRAPALCGGYCLPLSRTPGNLEKFFGRKRHIITLSWGP